LQFCDYNKLDEIGFKDKRPASEKGCSLEEYRQRVGFLTRTKGNSSDEDNKGDVLFNIIEVDSYSFPMKYTHYVTKFEAGMSGGVRDDIMHRAFVLQV